MSITPDSPRWAELVATGQQIASSRNWFLGDAALEIAPMSPYPGGVDRGIDGLLERFAEEVGVSFHTIKQCRFVAHAWPIEKRTIKTSWNSYRILMAADKQHLLVDGIKQHQALEAAGWKAGHEAEVQRRVDAALEKMYAEAAAAPEPVASTYDPFGRKSETDEERAVRLGHEFASAMFYAGRKLLGHVRSMQHGTPEARRQLDAGAYAAGLRQLADKIDAAA